MSGRAGRGHPPHGDLRPDPSESRARRFYRLLLLAYPRRFRQRYADDMASTFAAAWRRARERGPTRTFWLRSAGHELRQGMSERLSALPILRPTGRRPTGIGADVRLAARALGRNPAFAVVVCLTLALGIGVNVAVLSLVDAVLLRPLPVHDPGSLVAVYEALNERSLRGGVSYATYRDLRDGETGLGGLAAYIGDDGELLAGSRPERVSMALVSGSYFSVLGVSAQSGRTLVASDEGAPGTTPVIVISDALWARVFGRAADAVGRTVRLGGSPFTIVGVAPAGFRGVDLSASPDLWIPITMAAAVSGDGLLAHPDALTTRALNVFHLVGRLGEVPAPAVVAALNRVRRAVDAESLAENVAQPMSVLPLVEAAAIGDREALVRFLALLACVAGLTLLVACVNVANLLLVRARQRAQELAVRSALGAGRARLFRQLAVEALVLAGVAGGGAVVVAYATMTLLAGFTLPGDIAVSRTALSVDGRALAVALGLTLLTAAVFGTFPALRGSRMHVAERLRTRGADADRAVAGTWNLLLAAQVGLSVLLLVGAALFARTLQEALRTDLGFRPDSVAAVSVALRPHGYTRESAPPFVASVLADLQTTRGISRAAFAGHVPLAPRTMALPVAATAGGGAAGAEDGARGAVLDGTQPGTMNINIIAGDYFAVLGIPLVAGRTFDARDAADVPGTAIVNETAARTLWPDDAALGRTLQIFPPQGPVATVVGIVADTRYHTVADRGVPYVYRPLAQEAGVVLDVASFIARSPAGAGPALDALTPAIGRLDATLPTYDPRHVDRQLAAVMAPQRFGAALLGVFSLVALLIAGVGIYGVAAYTVTLERRAIGIRMALGAQSTVVVRGVLGQTLLAAVIGGAAGIAAAAVFTRLLGSFLYGVGPRDPQAFVVAVAALGVTAAVAAALPARRAAAVDPLEALRTE